VISQRKELERVMPPAYSSRRFACWSILLTIGIVQGFGGADRNKAVC
jgi:hypothetical protein